MTKAAMQWASVVSQQTELEANVEEIKEALQAQWGDGTADIAFVFVSPHFSEQYHVLPARLREVIPARVLVGCSGGGVVGIFHQNRSLPANLDAPEFQVPVRSQTSRLVRPPDL